MRNSNSKDKNSTQGQNRLMKTQVPPKPKQIMESTQYNQNSSNSNKRIDSSKQLPPRSNGANFKIQQNMTQSKICQAKSGLQLLKKRMQKTGMSRQKSGNSNSMQKTSYAPQSLKKISQQNQSNKNLQNYQQEENNAKLQTKPSKKIVQLKKQSSNQIQKKQPIKRKQPQTQEYVNYNQEVPISKNQDFYALLQRQMAKQANLKNIPDKNLSSNVNKKSSNTILDQNGQNIKLYQCTKGCGRMFNQQVLPKHQKICQKVFQSKRKAFNSAAFRQVQAEGDFQKAKQPTPKKLNQTKNVQKAKQKIPKWKLQSAQLRGGLKLANGGKQTAQQLRLQKAQNDMMVPCNYCGRKFSQKASVKHIPFCQNKAKQIPKFNTTKKK